MTKTEIQRRFEQLQVWQRRGRRAPHKPLLALRAIGRCLNGEARMASYRDVDAQLGILLREFGPSCQRIHTEYPFWRLQRDGVWELTGAKHVATRRSNTDAKKSELLRLNVHGGLTRTIHDALRQDPALAFEIAGSLVAAHFPESRHAEIFEAVGIDSVFTWQRRRPRDVGFRDAVLRAYEYRCAICEFDVHLADRIIGLEAAHIKWHQAGGPERVENGLSLCVLHHKLFDCGAFTLSGHRTVRVAESAHGTTGFDEWRGRFHGRAALDPIHMVYRPAPQFAAWRHARCFAGPHGRIRRDGRFAEDGRA